MVVGETSSPQEPPSKVIKDVLSGLEPKGFELPMVPLEIGRRWEQAWDS